MKRSALVLGANAGQADLVRWLLADGWRVAACAHKPGGQGAALADAFALIDVADVGAVEAYAREQRVDLIYSVSSDVTVRTVVEASKRLGLPHYFDGRLVELLNSKPALRAHLNQHGLSVTPFATVATLDAVEDWDVYPCMVKPADAQGSRGIAKVTSREGLADAIEKAAAMSADGKAIVEQFLEGEEMSSNVFVANGEVIVNEISERLVHDAPLVGIPSGHLIPPVNIDADMAERARTLVVDVIRSLGVTDGTLYFQMKATPDGPKIVEIAPRLDGCHIWRLMTHACGIDFLELAARRLVGDASPVSRREPYAVYELMFQQAAPGTTFRAAVFPAPADALYHEHRYADGETIAPVNGSLEVVGYYVRRRAPDAAPSSQRA